jgi:4-hydroxythreonine-4-phosphate dehydrogenase
LRTAPDSSPDSATHRVRLAVTLGDPRGIGPEVVRQALDDATALRGVDVRVVGPTGLDVAVHETVGDWQRGADVATAGALAGRAIARATALALAGDVDGIVTAPVDKSALAAGGYDYPGHTEMLAALCDAEVAMMLASETLRVVLVTTHLPLRDVPSAVTAERIERIARVTRDGLRDWFGIAAPRLALCALNPHAGDGGRFGREDQDVLLPAAQAAGIAGPLPADTVFVRAMRGEFDAVLAPYHDVGMTAIKVASFGHAVNVTLGLPFPRTSPDHGTALDIAGMGIADPSSMKAALRMCSDIARRIMSRRNAPQPDVASSPRP